MHTRRWLLYLLIFILIGWGVAGQCGYFSARGGEYERYVHSYVDSFMGNWTYLEKPVFPVLFNESQIPIGQNWSIVCPLVANSSYHVYCYGEWVNNGSEPKTDYDIYVYNPRGEMEGYHTEAAGLPEHLGSTVNEAFFVPRSSGNYTFEVRNDPRESNGTEKATFMIVENAECNKWHSHYMEGKNNANEPQFATSWACEFCTESRHIELWVRVPDTLDMYETRVYLMGNPQSRKGMLLNNVPLAWEPGLYGNRSGSFGGYNLESTECRGLAYASCEFYGQDMFLNFTSPVSGKSLYHLVFIGEAGYGELEFLVKTEFGNASLKPAIAPSRVYPNTNTVVAYVSNSTDLTNATLQYSTNDWKNSTVLSMEISGNRTCRIVVPAMAAGTEVAYRVEAHDVLENVLRANGSYVVKHPTSLNVSLPRRTVTLGENITVRGHLTPANGNLTVEVDFVSANLTQKLTGSTLDNGTFTASFKPEALGSWRIQGVFNGDAYRYESESEVLIAEVEEPSFFVKYSFYIGGGVGAVAVVGIIVYWKKFRV